MKYIIENEQLFNVIYKFISDEFKDIYFSEGYDYTHDEETEDLVFFRDDDYDDNYFEYVKPTWYTRRFDSKTREDEELTNKWLPKTPILDVFRNHSTEKLNSIFGGYWKPVFEKWFEDTYPQFPVKTYNYTSFN